MTETGVRELTDAAVRTVPAMADLKMTDAWSGFRPFAPDGLPVIGELDEMFVATAHYRNGILLAPVTAEIVADKIMNETDSNISGTLARSGKAMDSGERTVES